jgi:hypothetical protein
MLLVSSRATGVAPTLSSIPPPRASILSRHYRRRPTGKAHRRRRLFLWVGGGAFREAQARQWPRCDVSAWCCCSSSARRDNVSFAG